MKTILSIIPYKFTLKDFFEMREPINHYPLDIFYKRLPEWCVREDNGVINYTENYHQFSGTLKDDNPKEFYLFDINPIDLLLQEEISNIGVHGVFEGYDWRPLFKEIPVNEAPIKSIQIPFSVHVVVDIEYHYCGDNDYDTIIEVLGFLDGRMDLRRI